MRYILQRHFGAKCSWMQLDKLLLVIRNSQMISFCELFLLCSRYLPDELVRLLLFKYLSYADCLLEHCIPRALRLQHYTHKRSHHWRSVEMHSIGNKFVVQILVNCRYTPQEIRPELKYLIVSLFRVTYEDGKERLTLQNTSTDYID